MALVALLAPASALADSIGAVGINDLRSDGILLSNSSWNGPADLDLSAAAGIQLYRARIQLNCVDPAHTGRFNFTATSPTCYGLSYDALVRSLAQRNMTLLPVLMNFAGALPQPPTPDGAGGAPTTSEFAAFAAAAAARYGQGGAFWSGCGCAPHPIEAWEVWNEENNGWWWGGNASAGGYAALFSATRTALRSVDAQARVIVGGLAFDPNSQPSFVAPADMIQALAATNANAFDAVAVHPYTEAAGASSGQLASDAMTLINQAAADVAADTGPGPGGAPRQQIWVTEMGWSNQSASPDTISAGIQSFFGMLDGGARSQDNIGPVLWYDLRDNSTLADRDDQIGLRYTAPNGSDGGPKPAWAAFAAAAQQESALPLPPALTDSAPYVAPVAPAPPASVASITVAGPRASVASAWLTHAVPRAVIRGSAQTKATTSSSAKQSRPRVTCGTTVTHNRKRTTCTSASRSAPRAARVRSASAGRRVRRPGVPAKRP